MERFSETLDLPHDIWVAITIKVVSNSIQDLCNLKMTCNATREAGEEDIVHTSVSIPPPLAMSWWWHRDPEAIRFFDRCMDCGHPELLFREALWELCMRRNQDVGLEMLHNAASKGHDAAKYTLSMMLLLRRNDKEAKRKGIELFHALDAAGLLTVCNSRCFEVLTILWPGEVQMPEIQDQHLVCDSRRRSTRGHMGLLYDYRRWAAEWNSIHGFGGAAHIPCIHYRADYKLRLFVNLP